ncbi:MAG TPA: hypothetical protein VLB80_02165 [Candidatus Babeliales bacterium]|nr:hypothetical protein [Candidatus Babeliales bacterium]
MHKRSLFFVLSIMMINILIKAMDSFETSQKCIVPSLKSIAEQHIIRNHRNNHPCDHIDQLLKNENIPYDFHDDLKEEFVKQYAGHGLSGGFNQKQLYNKSISTAIVDDQGKHVFFVSRHSTNIEKLDTESGAIVGYIQGHTNNIFALISHNELLISGSADDTIKLWNLNNNKCITTLYHGLSVYSLSAEKNIVCSTSLNDIKLWDISSGKCFQSYNILCLKSHLKNNILYGISNGFSDEKYINFLLRVDIRSSKYIKFENINDFDCFVNHPDVEATLYVGKNNSIEEWDMRKSDVPVHIFYHNKNDTNAMTIQNNILYATTLYKGTIKLYNIQNHTDIGTLPTKAWIWNLQIHNSGLYAAGGDGLIKLTTNSYDDIYNALKNHRDK